MGSIDEIPSDYKEEAEKWRHTLEEAIVECDDALMEKYLEGETPSPEDLRRVLREAVCQNKIIPVLCGSAFKNKGVQLLLDAIVDYLPAPSDVEGIKGTLPDGEEAVRLYDPSEPFSALAFKVMNDRSDKVIFLSGF